MNHYERLNVTQDAPPEVIRAAYRALANRLHPDRNPPEHAREAEAAFADVSAAHELLSDQMAHALDCEFSCVAPHSLVHSPSGAVGTRL